MLAFLLCLPLWAQVVAVSTPQTNPLDYENHLLQHPSQLSFVQFHLKKQDQTSEDLFAYLKRGQFYFLDGQLDLAKKYFQKIIDLTYESDWGEKERKAIHFSFLRMAQLTSHPPSQQKFLLEALNFDCEQVVDRQVFPPPLVQQYNNLLKHRKSQVFLLPPQTHKFDLILINGKTQMGLKSFVKIPKQKVRISFLSNSYKPKSYVTSTDLLQDLQISLEPLLKGSCERPEWDKKFFQNQKIRPIWPDCHINKTLTLPTLIDPTNAPAKASSPKFQFLKSKWFWAGVSVLATGALLHHRQHQVQTNPIPQPQQTATQITILSNTD